MISAKTKNSYNSVSFSYQQLKYPEVIKLESDSTTETTIQDSKVFKEFNLIQMIYNDSY